ncbi:clustered mitochondria protein 1 [Monosporozyma unispora]|nr:Intracellular distribution of mitochondria [Kazachstania unispora]
MSSETPIANSNVKVTIKLPADITTTSHSHSHHNKKAQPAKDKLTFQFNRETKVQTVLEVLGIANETKYLTNIELKSGGQVISEDAALSTVVSDKVENLDFTIQLKPYTTREALKHVVVLRDFIGFTSETEDSLTEFAVSTGVKFPSLPLAAIKDKKPEEPKKEGEEEPKKNIFHVSEEEKENTKQNINDIFESLEDSSVKDLLTTQANIISPCVRSINLSQYNPVPAFYKSKGHLLYLQIVTLEGENFHITSTPSGFYVNKSTNTKFDPSHKTYEDAAHLNEKVFYNLFNLLAAHSKKFVSHVETMEAKLAKLESVSYVKPLTTFLHKPWLVSSNNTGSAGDYFRLQSDSIDSNLSSERNFNDEFQAVKDLPVETLAARMDSERLSAKLIHDFSVAATKGAMSIFQRNLLPMNPDAPDVEQIFLKDNIFYSFVTDVSGTYENRGGDEAARVAANQDILTLSVLNRVNLKDVRYLLTTVVDLAGKRVLAQTPVPGLLNTVGAETVKDELTGEEVLKDLESDISINYGFDEETKTLIQNEKFEKLLTKEFTKLFHLKKGDDAEKSVAFSASSKGITGLDKRDYILDLANTYPLDINFVKENFDGVEDPAYRYPHRQTLIRPELIQKWWTNKVQVTEGLDSNTAYEEGKFAYNPDAYQIDGVEDETVDEISKYLNTIVIPGVIEDFVENNASPPYNGEHLVDILHKNGINIRYIGKIAQLTKAKLDEQVSEHEKRLKEIVVANKEYEDWEAEYLIKVQAMITERQNEINKYVQAGKEVPKELLEDLKLDDKDIKHPTEEAAFIINYDELVPIIKISEIEMVARATKHILRAYSKELPHLVVSSLVAYVFNLLFGTTYNESPAPEEVDEFYPLKDYPFTTLTREDLLKSIQKEVALRFRYSLSIEDLTSLLENKSLLMRTISYRFGIQWVNKKYYYTNEEFEEFKASQDKKLRQKLVAPVTTFSKDDLTVIPRVKTTRYSSIASEDYWTQGSLLVTENKQTEGLTFMAQAIAILEDVLGVVHPEVAEKYMGMATIYSKLNLIDESVAFCRKAATIYERTCGIDSFEMTRALYNLALLELANESPYNNTLISNRIIQNLQAYNLTGLHHPTASSIIRQQEQISLGVEDIKLALKSLNTLSDFVVKLDGKGCLAYAYIQSQIGNLCATMKDHRAALEHISYAKDVFFTQLGSNHKTTATSKQWINGLSSLMQDLSQKKQMEQEQMQAAGITAPAKKSHSKKKETANPELANKSVDELLNFIEGAEAKSKDTKKPKSKKKHGKK